MWQIEPVLIVFKNFTDKRDITVFITILYTYYIVCTFKIGVQTRQGTEVALWD